LLKILKSRLEVIRLARRWRYWSRRIAEASKSVLGDCEVYVFGSYIEGEATGGSDVDILIISDRVPQKTSVRWDLISRIEDLSGLPPFHPYEIHLVNRREAEWYFKFIRKKVRIL